MEVTINGFIARDKSGIASIFTNKPIKNYNEDSWEATNGKIELDESSFFTQVKWEDNTPVSAKLTIRSLGSSSFFPPTETEATIEGWIGRNKNNSITLFGSSKPQKYDDGVVACWYSKYTDDVIDMDDNSLFPQIKWEDFSPTPATITIDIKKKE